VQEISFKVILGATGVTRFGLVHAQTFEKGRGKGAPGTIAPGIVKQRAFGMFFADQVADRRLIFVENLNKLLTGN